MSIWSESLVIDGSKIDPNITDAIPQGGAILTGTMEGAESLELTVSDPDMRFLASGALTRRGKPSTRQQDLKLAAWQRFGQMRLSLDGVWFRFAGASFSYDTPPWSITLTFESEIATVMRQHDRAVKWSRGRGTRVGFITHLALLARGGAFASSLPFLVYSPDPSQRPDVAKVKDENRKKGISPNAHLTIRGQQINADQRRNLEISLTEAERETASERVFLGMLVAGIGESGFTVIPNQQGSDYGGVFQGKFKGTNPQFEIGDTKGMAHYFLVGGKGFQQGGAIRLAASDEDLTPGEIAYKVEGSRANFPSDSEAENFYQQHLQEARAILSAWGGASQTITIRESYEFRAGEKDTSGKRENYWDASGRLVDQVRWRRFATQNIMWVGPDEWFFKNRPVYVIDGSKNFASQGFLGFTGNVDVGMPISELSCRILAPRWTAGPGTVLHFDAPSMPIDGRWLIWDNRLDLTQSVEIAEITLRRPAPTKKEPAPGTTTKTVGASESPGDLAYPVLNRRGTFIQGPYGSGTHRGGQNWQSSNAIDIGVPVGSTLVAVDDGTISPPSTPYSGFGDSGQGGRFAGKRLHLKTDDNAWFYTHMSEITVEAGDVVKKGDVIGKSGSANGVAHLHIAIERGDPKKLLGW